MSRFTAALLLVAASSAATHVTAETLRVGLDPRSAPWAFVPGLAYDGDFTDPPSIDATSLRRVEGIDVDVARSLARHLGAELELVPVGYYGLEQALVEGRIDAIVNAWNATGDTSADIAATSAYYEWGLLLAARRDDQTIRAFEDLVGRRVGHFHSRLVLRTLHSTGAELVAYDGEEALFDDLRNGAIDALLYDSPAVRWRVSRDERLHVVGEPLNRLGYHVAVRRRDEALRVRLEQAVRQLVASGGSERIRARWESGGAR